MPVMDYRRKFIYLAVIWLSMSFSTPLTHAFGFTAQSFFLRLLITTGFLALLHFYEAYPLLPSIFLGTLAAAAVLLRLFFPVLFIKIKTALLLYTAEHGTILFLLMVAAITLLFWFLLTKVKKHLFWLFLLGIGAFIPLWYMYIDSAYSGAVSYALCWFLLLSYQTGGKYWHKLSGFELQELRNGWINYTTWILFYMLVFALILPKKLPPLHWEALQNWADSTFPFLAELRGGEVRNLRGTGSMFEIFSLGFGDEESLGGPLKQDKTVLMEITGRAAGQYLRGSVKKIYTGTSWLTAPEEEIWEPDVITATVKPYLRPVTLEITHKRLKTNTVFSPLYTTNLKNFTVPVYQTDGNAVFIREEIPLNRTYVVEGMVYRSRGDFSAMEKGQHGSELDSFLLLPENLPERIREVAEEVTANKDGYYAKMKALENYLRTSLTYDLNPSPLPEGQDFVDYFLFADKRGYCTAFASALAVMGRAVGVPTRYVQGFKMPEATDTKGIFHIAGTNAHAWVEAYIPNIGWMIFEATPVFPTMDSLPAAAPIYSGDVTQDLTPTPKEPGFSTNDMPPEPGRQAAPYLRYFGIFFSALLVSFLLFFTFIIFRRRRQLKQMFADLEKQPPRLQAAAYYNLTLPLLAAINLGKIPGETPLEYSRRINRQVSDWKQDFQELSQALNQTLYSREGETPAELVHEMKAFFDVILRKYIVSAGKFAAFWAIYVQKKYLFHPFASPHYETFFARLKKFWHRLSGRFLTF
ncbi:MAG: hypothetical protein GX357_07835 [Firmicutes bacterium]|nr:hypothetical protein [Bacillota bacterium]